MPAKIERSGRSAATKPVTGSLVNIHDTLRIKVRSKGVNVAPPLNFFLPFIQTCATAGPSPYHHLSALPELRRSCFATLLLVHSLELLKSFVPRSRSPVPFVSLGYARELTCEKPISTSSSSWASSHTLRSRSGRSSRPARSYPGIPGQAAPLKTPVATRELQREYAPS
jgi:hypothetical protein